MPKLGCLCGGVIDLSPIPCPDEWALLPASVLGRMADYAAVTPRDALGFWDMYRPDRRAVYVCPDCERLWVETAPKSGRFEPRKPSGLVLEGERCSCGRVLSSDEESVLLPDELLDDLAQAAARVEATPGDVLSLAARGRRRGRACPDCGRLRVETAPRSGVRAGFDPEARGSA